MQLSHALGPCAPGLHKTRVIHIPRAAKTVVSPVPSQLLESRNTNTPRTLHLTNQGNATLREWCNFEGFLFSIVLCEQALTESHVPGKEPHIWLSRCSSVVLREEPRSCQGEHLCPAALAIGVPA